MPMKTIKPARLLSIPALSIVIVSVPLIALAQTRVLQSPFTGHVPADPSYIVAAIIQALLGVVGAVTLLIFIWGGMKMIFSGGNEEKIKKGRDTLLWAAIGLAIILSSYSILQYVFTLLRKASIGSL